MNLRTLSLAFAIVVCANLPIIGQQTKNPAGGPKPTQGSPMPLEIKGDRVGESFEDFKKHYPQIKCHERSEVVTECQQNTHVSLAGEETTDEYCGPDVTDSHSVQNCLFQGIHAWFEAGKLKELLYSLPILAHEEVCESFAEKYGKPNDLTKVEGGSTCSWVSGGILLQVSHSRPPLIGTNANLHVMVLLSDSRPSKDI